MPRRYRNRRPRRRLRRAKRSMMKMSKIPTVLRFKESYGQTITIPANSSNQTFTICPAFSSLTNCAAYQALFDLYNIKGFSVKLINRTTSYDVSSGVGAPQALITVNRDPYLNAPLSVNDILNDDGVRVWNTRGIYKQYVKNPQPDVKGVDVSGNAVTLPIMFGNKVNSNRWLTTGGNNQYVNNSGVKWYGLRGIINNPSTYDMVFDLYITLYFACKERD